MSGCLAPTREANGERAAHGVDLSVERELADDCEQADRVRLN